MKTKQKLKRLSRKAAVFTAVILTNILLSVVEIAKFLGEEETIEESTVKDFAMTRSAQPDHVELEGKRRSMIRNYSKALREMYVPTIDELLNEEEARRGSLETRSRLCGSIRGWRLMVSITPGGSNAMSAISRVGRITPS
ncbi:hypothetical protein DOTSEDRAFT_26428 [Dothistroma septosporum NZE10]|uniref:Uncharacterized protein n=1 Tax=Dothistroma septosporum (strain NZE10 / CBS 128990) TaxID=675120 RepID=N1PF48_DOTSN|nr:hypothetical protein DOTSEDRAFT_26428 [Dothistroma septosporum NZE10]